MTMGTLGSGAMKGGQRFQLRAQIILKVLCVSGTPNHLLSQFEILFKLGKLRRRRHPPDRVVFMHPDLLQFIVQPVYDLFLLRHLKVASACTGMERLSRQTGNRNNNLVNIVFSTVLG